MGWLGMLLGSGVAQVLGGTAAGVLRSDDSRVRSLAAKLGISEADARQLRIDLAGNDDSRLPSIAGAFRTSESEARRLRAEFHEFRDR